MTELPRRFENLLKSFTPEQKKKFVATKDPQIINEEIGRFCNNIPSDKLTETLKTLHKSLNENQVLDSLESSLQSNYNKDSAIIDENWEFFVDALRELSALPEFQKKCKQTYNKLYAVKYFTNGTFVDKNSLEENIKYAIKNYFDRLVTDNPDEFIEVLFTLPLEFVGSVVRYTTSELVPDKREQLVPTQQEAKQYLDRILQLKDTFIKSLLKITQEEHNVFSFSEAILLVEVRAFFKDDEVHNGILEYLMRMINNATSREKLYDLFGKDRVAALKQDILRHPNYVNFLTQIKRGNEQPFFSQDGAANPNRELPFVTAVEEYLNPELKQIRKAEKELAAQQATAAEEQPPEEEPEQEPEGEEGEGGEEPGDEGPPGGEPEIAIPTSPEG